MMKKNDPQFTDQKKIKKVIRECMMKKKPVLSAWKIISLPHEDFCVANDFFMNNAIFNFVDER